MVTPATSIITNFAYTCNDSYPCTNQNLTCVDNDGTEVDDYTYNCTFICNGTNVCANSTIDCGYSTKCDVLCNQTNACKNATINGNYTNYLNWSGIVIGTSPASYRAAQNSSIYCPIPFFLRTTLQRNGTINGYSGYNYNYSNFGYSCEIACPTYIQDIDINTKDNECDYINIYSMPGFNHMLIDPFNGYHLKNSKIYCGEQYQHICDYGMVCVYIQTFDFQFQSIVYFKNNRLH